MDELEDLYLLSVEELQAILSKKKIDTTNITERGKLIFLIKYSKDGDEYGKPDPLPEHYLNLFKV